MATKQKMASRVRSFGKRGGAFCIRGADWLIHYANTITACAAIAALLFSGYQIDYQRKLQAEANTYQIYNEFVTKSMDYPDFICVNTPEKLKWAQNTDDPQSINKANPEKLLVRYRLYRQLMMSTMEQILLAVPDHRDWVISADLRIACHLPYYASDDFTVKKYLGWSCVMRDLIAYEFEKNREKFPVVKPLACTENEWDAQPKNGLFRPSRIDYTEILREVPEEKSEPTSPSSPNQAVRREP